MASLDGDTPHALRYPDDRMLTLDKPPRTRPSCSTPSGRAELDALAKKHAGREQRAAHARSRNG